MLQVISFSHEGQPQRTTMKHPDPQLVSNYDENRAVETWQIGVVNGRLSINHMTVNAVSAMAGQHSAGEMVKVTYRCQSRPDAVFEEILFLGPIADWVLLETIRKPGKEEAEIVRKLKCTTGDFVTATFRIVDIGCRLSDPPPHLPDLRINPLSLLALRSAANRLDLVGAGR